MAEESLRIVEDLVLSPRAPIVREVRAGQTLRVTDREGQQVGDLSRSRWSTLRRSSGSLTRSD
jgi:uncharacterized protein YcgI (DUF1989 family)